MKKCLTIEDLREELKSMGVALQWDCTEGNIKVINTGYCGKENVNHLNYTLPTIIYSNLVNKYSKCTYSIIESYMHVIAKDNCVNYPHLKQRVK